MITENIADKLIAQALQIEATDVHIIPRQKDYLIRFRLHGHLTSHQKIPPTAGERLISHLKFMASMDISEKRKPQSGSWQIKVNDKLTALRISTLPTALSKESLVIRILPKNLSHSLEKMSLFPNSISRLISMALHSHGMIIFTGPTGSGKSTTMYALAEHCSLIMNRNVITLEDPVEKQNDQFLQVQVNEKAGITYSAGLKAILRHDPDIIIMGEIRDAETAKIAIRAAMTGHLVMTSLHTRNAEGAIYRLLEFGVNRQEIEQTLIGVTAQRLVSLLCPFCGSVCSKYCSRELVKRAGVFEILEGSALHQTIVGGSENMINNYHTLGTLIRKGIALGYISDEEYSRWIIEKQTAAESKGTRLSFYKIK